MDAPSLRRAQTAAGSSAQAALPALMRSWSAPRRRHELGPTLCLEVPWKSRPRSLPCPHALEGFVEVVALDGRRSQEEVMRAQFLCHRSKFASQLVGFSRSPPGCQESTVFFYTKPDHLLLEKLGLLSHLQRLAVAHGAATALWTLHSLGASFGRLEVESLGLRAGRLQLVGVGLLQCQEKVSKDLEDLASLLLCMLGFPMREDQSGSMASGELWKRLLMASKKGDITERDQALQQRDNDWPENEAKLLGNLALRLLQVAQEADVERVAENALQNVVTDLATLLRSHHPPEGLDSRRFSPNTRAPRGHGWKVLRHVLRACWAFQQGLEAFCCVCLEVAPKSLGLLCPQLHGRYQLLCGDCLEPYVCSLIGTAELRRHEGGVVCPACACNCEEPTIFSRQQVQARLAGAALRRFVEATEEVEVAPEDPEEDEEWSVLVEDLNTRSVRLATHSRVSEDDEPKVLRRTKDVLPFTWLLCEGDSTYIQYEPDRMKLHQHMSPRLFHLQVAECLTMHCPRCHCPLDPDPDGCVAMTCLACNEGFCWVCFTACGDDAHEHAMDAHGSYFPGQDFVQAWHRKLRWQRVQQILQQLREDSQDESLKGCQALLADVDLWRFPREAPEVPEAVPGDVEEHAGPWGPVGLHLAARLGRLDAVGEALQREDVNLQDNRGMTPLCYACHEGRMEVIRLLMERQADPNVADLHGVTPLHYACREPPFPILEDVAGLLLSYPQVDANQRDESGASAILVAAEVGRHQVMPSLLRCERLDPNLTNHAGRTALLVAASFDHTQVVVELLRSERVKVDLRGQDGETPLLLAAKRGSLELVQLLLSHPDTEPHAVNRTGRTALMEAANLGASEVVRCLLASGEVDRQDSSGCTALMLAAHSGSVETFEQLLPLSPNLQQRDVQGFTVLMRLAERGSQKGLTAHACLELLLSSVPRSRVEINAQNVDGSTALMLAVRNGCVPSVETLLDHGAGSGTSLHDLRGETAWTLASLCRPETFRALRHILPREEATTFMLLYDGLLFHSVERANRTLLAGGDLQLWNSTLLTVEFECREFRKWKEAGYQIFPREIFFQQHEECTHELEIQRVNGQSFANQELRETDSIKVRNCKHVRRLESWRKEGWTLSEDGRKLCHWGARKMVNLVVVEESCTETWEAVEEFLDIFA